MAFNAQIAERSERKRPSPMDVLTALVADDLSAVETLLSQRAVSSIATIPDMSAYLISAGGKRLRPLITLAAAYAAGGNGSAPLHSLAAAVEFIHTATLLHDDVVDESDLRRGKKAAKMVWGNSASILVGDFLFARAFTLMVETRSIRILDILSNASCVIAEGEVKQLAAIGKADLPIDDYMEIVEAKTAALFEAAARAGALTVVKEGKESDALAEYGRRLGRAFQLVDDALDYGGVTSVIGKSVGDDFREGKLTLPVLLARETGDETARTFWDRAMNVSQQTEEDLQTAIEYIRQADSVKLTLEAAENEIEQAKEALKVLEPSPYVDALCDVADFCVNRIY